MAMHITILTKVTKTNALVSLYSVPFALIFDRDPHWRESKMGSKMGFFIVPYHQKTPEYFVLCLKNYTKAHWDLAPHPYSKSLLRIFVQ